MSLPSISTFHSRRSIVTEMITNINKVFNKKKASLVDLIFPQSSLNHILSVGHLSDFQNCKISFVGTNVWRETPQYQ